MTVKREALLAGQDSSDPPHARTFPVFVVSAALVMCVYPVTSSLVSIFGSAWGNASAVFFDGVVLAVVLALNRDAAPRVKEDVVSVVCPGHRDLRWPPVVFDADGLVVWAVHLHYSGHSVMLIGVERDGRVVRWGVLSGDSSRDEANLEFVCRLWYLVDWYESEGSAADRFRLLKSRMT